METMLNQEARQVAFYSCYTRLTKYIILFLMLDLFLTASFITFLFVASGIPFMWPSPDLLLVRATQIFAFLLSLTMMFLITWVSSFLLFTTRRLVSHRPALLITPEGVHIQDLPMAGNVFLTWSDIAFFSEYRRRSDDYLCLDLKERVRLLSQFHWLQQLFMRLEGLSSGSLIKIPHWFLSEPVEEVLSHIQQIFSQELIQHHIQVFRINYGDDYTNSLTF